VAVLVAVLLLVSLLALVPAALRIGRGRTPVRRRLAIAGLLAGASILPALPVPWLGWTIARGTGHYVVEDPAAPRQPVATPAGPVDLVAVVGLWLVLLRLGIRNLRLHRVRFGRDGLREVDPAVTARVTELAAQFGLPPTQVWQAAGSGPALAVHAVTGGALVPIIVVGEGVLHRLAPEERDAVIAHELAHVAQHAVLRRIAWHALLALAVVLASGWLPLLVALALALAARGFLDAWVGHGEEVAADLAAGRWVGFAVMASALDKTHADALQADSVPWFHAVLSHPALAVRAYRLRQAAPADLRRAIEVDESHVQRCLRARRLAMALWPVLLLLVAVAGAVPAAKHLAVAVGLAVAAIPLAPHLVFVREYSAWLQTDPRAVWRWVEAWLPWAVAIASLPLALLARAKDAPLWWLPLALGAACAAHALRTRLRVGPLRRELNELFANRDFAGYLRRCEALAPALRRQPEQRLQENLARAATGAPMEAAEELLRVASEHRSARYAALWAIVLLRPRDPERAVRVGRDLVARMPGSPLPEALLAGALLYAGAAHEAWPHVERVVQRLPRHGGYHALRSRIALARGDATTAAASLLRAERLAPGDLPTLLARAEADVAAGSATAVESIARLRAAVQVTPLAFAEVDLARLERAVAAAP
jgi:Zn-dependent protease with chaperone function